MSQFLVLPSLRDLAIQLESPSRVVAPTLLQTIVANASDLQRLGLILEEEWPAPWEAFEDLSLNVAGPTAWQPLEGLRSLRSLCIICGRRLWMPEPSLQGPLVKLLELQELSLPFQRHTTEWSLSFAFLCRIPSCYPALRSLRLGIDISTVDDYDCATDGIVFGHLEELHLQFTRKVVEARYHSFVATLAKMCPLVGEVTLKPIDSDNSNNLEEIFFASQSQGGGTKTFAEGISGTDHQ